MGFNILTLKTHNPPVLPAGAADSPLACCWHGWGGGLQESVLLNSHLAQRRPLRRPPFCHKKACQAKWNWCIPQRRSMRQLSPKGHMSLPPPSARWGMWRTEGGCKQWMHEAAFYCWGSLRAQGSISQQGPQLLFRGEPRESGSQDGLEGSNVGGAGQEEGRQKWQFGVRRPGTNASGPGLMAPALAMGLLTELPGISSGKC